MHHTRLETQLHHLVLCSIGRREKLTSRKMVGRGTTSWRRNERDLSVERERERLFWGGAHHWMVLSDQPCPWTHHHHYNQCSSMFTLGQWPPLFKLLQCFILLCKHSESSLTRNIIELPTPLLLGQSPKIPCFKASPLIVRQIMPKYPISPLFEPDHARHTQVILTTQRLDSPSLRVSYYDDKIDAHCLMLSARS